jgi:YYY domain-containing protein
MSLHALVQRARVASSVWLAFVLVTAGVLRLIGLDWDQGRHLHPDERFLTMVETGLQWPASNFLASYLNEAESTLNPRNVGFPFFVYGDLPVILIKRLAIAVGQTGYDQVYLVGRAASAAVDVGTVCAVFLLARRIYGDRRVALLAASLYALCPLAIQQAHFFVVDNFSAALSTWSLYFLARTFQQGRLVDYAATGATAGLALASKVSIYPIFGLILIVAVYRVWARRSDRLPWPAALAEQTLFRLGLCGFAALLMFRIAEPYAFQAPGLTSLGLAQRWLDNMFEVRGMMTGELDGPPAHQWANRAPLLFPLSNMLMWGFGVPLGVTAWVGWAVAAWRLVRRGESAHLIPVLWTAFIFSILGTQWVKSIRYFLPIYPTLAVLAAWLLVWVLDQAHARLVLRGPWRLAVRWTRNRACALLAAVVIGTALFAVAFTTIYTRPHTRVSASQWIYANVAPGTAVANETGWDDWLPRPIGRDDPFAAGTYRGLDLDITADESEQKLQHMLDVLGEADYLFISSNRQYDSLPRIPIRFPLATRYYAALFDGRLGFERVAEFTSYPQLLFVQLPDQGADEAWTVYDHPRVQVFHKTPAFSRAGAEQLLGGIDWTTVLRLTARQATAMPNALMLTTNERLTQTTAGTWRDVFDSGSLTNQVPAPVWGIMLSLLGVVATPYVWLFARALPDRGYAIAKLVGLLLVAWSAWWLASLKFASFSGGAVPLSLLIVASGATAIMVKNRRAFMAWLRRARRLLLLEEALFWVLFGAFVVVRWLNPDLWHSVRGGEKPMDFAFLNAVTRTTYFAPEDPWFAGGAINYYYFGFVLVGTVIHLTGIVPSVAYNLALSAWFAFLGLAVFGLVLGLLSGTAIRGQLLRRPVIGALLGCFFAAVIGNLGEARLVLDALQAQSDLSFHSAIPGLEPLVRSIHGLLTGVAAGKPLAIRPEWWYWNATRVISHPPTEAGPITEFPGFTFLFGDLHAHLLALPYTAAVLTLVCCLVRQVPRATGGIRLLWLGRVALLALIIGSLWPLNTWDVPTYALLVAVGFGLHELRCSGHISAGVLTRALGQAALVVGLGYVAFLPFHQRYASAVVGFELWTGSRTSFDEYLTLNGFFLFVIASAMFADLRFSRDLNPVARVTRLALRFWHRPGHLHRLHQRLVAHDNAYTAGRWLLVCAVALALALWTVGLSAPALAMLLITLGLLLLIRSPHRAGTSTAPLATTLWQLSLCLAIIGLALTAAVEFVVVKDVDVGRMNTVFKFYLQAWVLLAVAAAAVLPRLVQYVAQFSANWRGLWRGVFVVLCGATLLYPVLATPARVADRFDRTVGPTLDGMAFLDRAIYSEHDRELDLTYDAQAIRWVQSSVSGTPVFAEANTAPTLYGWGNRFAMFTGNPDVIGWDWHERQQRGMVPGDLVSRRVRDVQQAYQSTDPMDAYRVFRQYGVQYFVVGELERVYFPGGQEKWSARRGELWDLVYENPGTQVYMVRDT